MLKNKLFITIASIIFVVLVGFSVSYLIKGTPAKIDRVSSILNGAKQAIKMDLNLAPEKIKWNISESEVLLSGTGCFYLDASIAPKLAEVFDGLDNYLKTSGFKNDLFNSDISDEQTLLKKYIKDEIVCNLLRKNNPNNTSSVSIACADINNPIFSFSSGLGNDCEVNSDCGVITDGCKRERVCRNLKYEFFNACNNPSQLVKDIDFSTAKCQCESNKCVPKKPGSSSPDGTNEPIIKLK